MSNRTADFIAGLIVGGFIGAAAALLLAPQPGDETVAQIRERGIELKERAADLSAEAIKRVNELEEKGKAMVEEQKGRVQQAVDEGKQAAEAKKEEMLETAAGKQAEQKEQAA